ncbi:universal stress protein [Nesterenkonia populi]|uniref:universal stress protein n=1 Tax=Nesterenkonia populi TaxID=1591087 RepID=UPI0011BF3768|nr:universal stress protein [Nesterenkonia populi]
MTDAPESTSPAAGAVVGVDGSEQSLRAAHWAAAEAHRRKMRLTVLTAYSMPAFAASSMDGGYAMMDDSGLRAGAEGVIDQAKEFLRDYPGEVAYRIEPGDPSTVLLEESRTAELIVIGTRGRGGFLGRLLGSVSSALPAHAHSPVVLVPLQYSSRAENAVTTATGAIPIVSAADAPGAEPPQSLLDQGATPIHERDSRPVVAGVDGSDYGRVAALTAAREASERQTSLKLVCALPPVSAITMWAPTHIDDADAVEELQGKLYAGALWLNYHYPTLHIEYEVHSGTSVDVLVEQTRYAQLTVLGTRGRGGFAGMLLGSTSQGVIQHAEGPLMVVPEEEDRRIGNRDEFGPVL